MDSPTTYRYKVYIGVSVSFITTILWSFSGLIICITLQPYWHAVFLRHSICAYISCGIVVVPSRSLLIECIGNFISFNRSLIYIDRPFFSVKCVWTYISKHISAVLFTPMSQMISCSLIFDGTAYALLIESCFAVALSSRFH